jgi:catechol 2,3-dioxygenase
MSATSTPSIAAGTTVGTVALTVPDPARSRAFYENVLGLATRECADGGLALGVDDEPSLVTLYGDSAAPPFDPHATGLFHLAILTPTADSWPTPWRGWHARAGR